MISKPAYGSRSRRSRWHSIASSVFWAFLLLLWVVSTSDAAVGGISSSFNLCGPSSSLIATNPESKSVVGGGPLLRQCLLCIPKVQNNSPSLWDLARQKSATLVTNWQGCRNRLRVPNVWLLCEDAYQENWKGNLCIGAITPTTGFHLDSWQALKYEQSCKEEKCLKCPCCETMPSLELYNIGASSSIVYMGVKTVDLSNSTVE